MTRELDKLDERLAETEQAHRRADDARRALTSFSEAGVDRLHRTSQERQAWEATHFVASSLQNSLQSVVTRFASAQHIPRVDQAISRSVGIDPDGSSLGERWEAIMENVRGATRASEEWIADVKNLVEISTDKESDLRVEVERALAKQGFDAAKLKEFNALDRQASLLPSYEAALDKIRLERRSAGDSFTRLLEERREVTKKQRRAFDRVIDSLGCTFEGRIRVRRVDEGDLRSLERFLTGLRQKGITRWWNDLEEDGKPSPETLVTHLDNRSLGDIGMSDPVQETFRESLTKSKRRELEALRCPDLYRLELRMDDDSYRALEELSGGQRVGVLLSLLLETADDRPLVIDQPEDELDNRFLFDTVLPALKKLSGRRQVIVATHNADIVVNGDADMVIQLDASAHHGKVACAGGIEDAAVRDAIVRTVDGGEEAFRLRLRKYDF